MKILTGNDLATGAVTWWTGSGWSLHVGDAADVADQGDRIAAAENAARRVVSPYVIAAEQTGGSVRPAHIKDRIRAIGPTVRRDLCLNADTGQVT